MTFLWIAIGVVLGLLAIPVTILLFYPLYMARALGHWSWNRVLGRWPVRGRIYRTVKGGWGSTF